LLPRERVIQVIRHRKPDRIPIYGWVRANLNEQITEAFGSVDNFEDRYEFDLHHAFGGPAPYAPEDLQRLRAARGGPVDPPALLEIELTDPDDTDRYLDIFEQLQHHKDRRGRFVYVQTPGIFECLNGPFGIENHLMYVALYEKELHEVYRRQAEWNRAFAMNCLDLGADMVHVSDDWGAQVGLLFNPRVWWELMFPYHKVTCDAVKQRGAFVSVHSDGNVMSVLDGLVELGYDVVHPYQESAGMDYGVYLERYRDAFVLMGGLDVQTTIGFGKLDFLKSEIERVMRLFADGGLLYCTTHYIQAHCSMEELRVAFDHVHDMAREVCR
jgi:uroporphyrinogen decarboxylase